MNHQNQTVYPLLKQGKNNAVTLSVIIIIILWIYNVVNKAIEAGNKVYVLIMHTCTGESFEREAKIKFH